MICTSIFALRGHDMEVLVFWMWIETGENVIPSRRFGTTNTARAAIENKRALTQLTAGFLVRARQSGLCQDKPSPPNKINNPQQATRTHLALLNKSVYSSIYPLSTKYRSIAP